MVWAKIMALGLDGNWRGDCCACGSPRRSARGHQVLLSPPGESRDATLSLVNEALNDLDLDQLYRPTDNVATRKREA